jgi:hypothetical protein
MEGQDAPARRQTATATAVDLNARLKTKAAPAPQIIDAEVMPDDVPLPSEPAPEPAPAPEPPIAPSVLRMVEAFAKIGISLADMLEFVDVESRDKITEPDIARLRKWYAELTRNPS